MNLRRMENRQVISVVIIQMVFSKASIQQVMENPCHLQYLNSNVKVL